MKHVFCFSIDVLNTASLVEQLLSSFLLASSSSLKIFSFFSKYCINICGKLWQQGLIPRIENNNKTSFGFVASF